MPFNRHPSKTIITFRVEVIRALKQCHNICMRCRGVIHHPAIIWHMGCVISLYTFLQQSRVCMRFNERIVLKSWRSIGISVLIYSLWYIFFTFYAVSGTRSLRLRSTLQMLMKSRYCVIFYACSYAQTLKNWPHRWALVLFFNQSRTSCCLSLRVNIVSHCSLVIFQPIFLSFLQWICNLSQFVLLCCIMFGVTCPCVCVCVYVLLCLRSATCVIAQR